MVEEEEVGGLVLSENQQGVYAGRVKERSRKHETTRVPEVLTETKSIKVPTEEVYRPKCTDRRVYSEKVSLKNLEG